MTFLEDKSIEDWMNQLNDEDPNSRKMAALALGEIEDKSPHYSDVMNRLVELLNDPDEVVVSIDREVDMHVAESQPSSDGEVG